MYTSHVCGAGLVIHPSIHTSIRPPTYYSSAARGNLLTETMSRVRAAKVMGMARYMGLLYFFEHSITLGTLI